MKIVVVLAFCCGIALANNALDDCAEADKRIEGFVEPTKDNAAALMLFEMRKIAGNLLHFEGHMTEYPQLKMSMTRMVQTFQYGEASKEMLKMFNTFDVVLEETEFNELESNGISTGLTNRDLYLTFMEAAGQLSQKIPLQDITDSLKIVYTLTSNLYFDMNKAFYGLLEMSIEYKSEAIKSVNKLNSEMAYITSKLKETEFGQKLAPLVTLYSGFLETLTKLDGRLQSTDLSETNKNFARIAIIKLHHIFRIDVAYDIFMIVIAALEQNPNRPHELISQQMSQSGFSFNFFGSLNKTLWLHMNDWLKEETDMDKFLAETIKMEVCGYILENIFFKILKSVQITEADVLSYEIPEGSDFEFVTKALKEGNTIYKMYQQNYELSHAQIGEELVRFCSHPFHLMRRMVQNVARKIIEVFGEKELNEEMKIFLLDIIQKLYFDEATEFLSNSNHHLSCESFNIKWLDEFDKACTELMDRLDRIDDEISNEQIYKFLKAAENNGADKMETDEMADADKMEETNDIDQTQIEEAKKQIEAKKNATISFRAQQVFANLRLIMFYFDHAFENTAMVPLEDHNQLVQSIGSIAGLSVQLKESNSNHLTFVNAITPLVEKFEAISAELQRIVGFYGKLANNPAQHRVKYTTLYKITSKLANGFKFADARDVLAYVALYLNDPQNVNSLGHPYAGIQTLCNNLESNMSNLKFVIEFAANMCEENCTAEYIQDQTKIWQKIWALNMGYSVNKALIAILEALPVPAEDQKQAFDAFTNLSGRINFKPFNGAADQKEESDLDMDWMSQFANLAIIPEQANLKKMVVRNDVDASSRDLQNQMMDSAPATSGSKRTSAAEGTADSAARKSRKRS